MSGYVGRLAPSPTGLLHLGHARTFSIASERAQAANGKLWLRDEDLDPQRSRAEYASAMREDLRWLGILWQEEMRQSARLPAYKQAMEHLIALGLVYVCTCSRRDLQQATQAPHEDTDDEPIYQGTCRAGSGKAPIATAKDDRECERTFESTNHPSPITDYLLLANYRFRVPDGELICFTDLHAGAQAFRAGCDNKADFGDFLVWRKDGLPSYQLACVVDDAAMSITEVVRGRDLLKSTARQILLQRALGFAMPDYFHCDLLRDETGVRLAKRHDALSLRSLRESGVTPKQIREMFPSRGNTSSYG